MSRVLIVEDDPAILCGLRDNLVFEQHQVLTAADGETGYRMLCEHRPDLVVLDLMLPKMSGYDVCRRARGEGFSAPILMLSARSEECDLVQGLDLGANDYVTKPFSLSELLARVRTLLRHEHAHREHEAQLNRDLEMAAIVQRELLPKTRPGIPGVEYDGVCVPARGVSGDYYDFIPVGTGKLGLLLVDVAGKGMPAALLGASLQAAVRANAPGAGENCGSVMVTANELLFGTSADDRYATVFYGVYDGDSGTLSYANAGHCPPMLFRAGACTRLDSMTPPLGMFPTVAEKSMRVRLEPGDWLLVFSDGVPDAENDQRVEFGEERMLTTMARLAGGSARQMCEGIVAAVRAHVHDGGQVDDITAVAVRVIPAYESASA